MQYQPNSRPVVGKQPALTGIRGYVLAGVSLAIALGIRAALDPIWGDRFPFMIFFVAVFVVIQLADWGPFLVALLGSVLLADWFFIPPRHSLAMAETTGRVNTVVFILISFLMLYFRLRMTRALIREQAAREELRRHAEALEESEARFSTIFRLSPIAIGFSRLADGRFVDVNETFLSLFGYTKEEVTERTCLELGMWPVPEERARFLQILQDKGRVHQFEGQFRRKSGEVGDQLVSAELLDLHGERYVLGMIQDITERKRMEERVRHSHKMEAIGHLAGGVAHEFNNILAAMTLNLDLLRMEASLPPMVSASLTDLQKGANRAATLTQRLLQFSRRHVMQTQTLDLGNLLDGLHNVLQEVLGNQVQIQHNPASAPLWVSADRAMLEQVITTLAVNARDAMPKGGLLRFNVQPANIDAAHVERNKEASLGSFVCLSVTDTGRGMAASERERVFEPFFTTKDFGRGVGLGLASVYGIVKQHQGWLEVESAPGAGTTFRIYLPEAGVPKAVTLTETGGAALRSLSLVKGSETVLLVEDEASVRQVFAFTLRRLGYRVLEAENGGRALELWEQQGNEVDLLFADMVLPDGMNGLELAEQLGKKRAGLKVVISSDYSMDLVDLPSPTTAKVRFLKKPFSINDLAFVVRESFDQHPAQP